MRLITGQNKHKHLKKSHYHKLQKNIKKPCHKSGNIIYFTIRVKNKAMGEKLT